MSHPVSKERTEEVVLQLIGFMDSAGICLEEGKAAMTELLNSFGRKTMSKNEFVDRRTLIISDMLDNPNEYKLYPTTQAFAALDDLFDELTGEKEGPSWAQIEADKRKSEDIIP